MKYERLTRILRRKQVESITGLSRSTIYLRMKKGTFPKQINIGLRSVGWLEYEIIEWMESCIQNRANAKSEIS
ncbi:MAG: AlpA family transcriptional regulator [Desulforhopalus sp.]